MSILVILLYVMIFVNGTEGQELDGKQQNIIARDEAKISVSASELASIVDDKIYLRPAVVRDECLLLSGQCMLALAIAVVLMVMVGRFWRDYFEAVNRPDPFQ